MRLGALIAPVALGAVLIPDLALAQEMDYGLTAAAVRMVGVLALILVLLIGGLYLMRRLMPARMRNKLAGRGIKVLSQHALGPKRALTVVEVCGQVLLLGVTDQNISLLTKIEDTSLIKAGREDGSEVGLGFGQALKRALSPKEKVFP